MNKLSTSKRAQNLGMLVEGMSMRAITRITVRIQRVPQDVRPAPAEQAGSKTQGEAPAYAARV